MSGGKLIRYISVVGVFTTPVIGGAILGYYLDEYFKTAPYFAAGLIFVGFVSGVYNLVKLLTAFSREMNR